MESVIHMSSIANSAGDYMQEQAEIQREVVHQSWLESEWKWLRDVIMTKTTTTTSEEENTPIICSYRWAKKIKSTLQNIIFLFS